MHPTAHPQNSIDSAGLANLKRVHWSLPMAGLVQEAVERREGLMAKDVALKSNMAMVLELQRFNAPQATERPHSKRQRDDVGLRRGQPELQLHLHG